MSVGSVEEARATVRKIVESQHHRGPDNTAVADNPVPGGVAVLGHNRLSIIDLSAEANQPLWDSAGEVCLALNGEMYNYVEVREELRSAGVSFRTQSDSEVLLEAYRAWGLGCLERFVGMFAFALFDKRSGTVHLARDRFGVKPLFVHKGAERVTWASTGRVMAGEFGLGPNMGYLHKGVTSWNFDDDSADSPYEGLESLRPGTWLSCRIESGRVRSEERRWYDLGSRAAALRETLAGESDRALCERVVETFDSACEYRLRSDVKVAIALSGGLDSGSVACTVGPQREGLEAFSFGDPGDAGTEAPLAKMLAEKAGIGITFIRPDVEELVSCFLPTLEAQDAPFVSVSQVAQYMVARQVRRSGFTVLLGGQGGDEAFMGYRKYFAFVLKEQLGSKRFGAAALTASQLPRLVLSERGQLANYWRHRKRFSGGAGGSVVQWPCGCEAPDISGSAGSGSWGRQMLDVTRFSLPTLLRYEDRNSMAHSIETRLPFLDQRVIELGLAMPERLKVSRGYGKYVLRQAMRGRVPDEVRLARYKLGFPVDQAKVVSGGLGGLVRGLLSENLESFRAHTVPGTVIETAFSDERLTGEVSALAEALSLIWIGRRF